MFSLKAVAVGLIVSYLGLLLVLNAIPHVRVRSFGYCTIRNITISHPQVKVTIEKIVFNFSLSRVVNSPFRALTLHFEGVVVKKSYSENAPENAESKESFSSTSHETVSALLPTWAYRYLFQKGWLNELAVQFHNVSIYHHWLDNEVSFHLSFVKIENNGNISSSKNKFSVSVIDGYLKSDSPDLQVDDVRLFHNLEVIVACTFSFSCPIEHRNKTKMTISDLKLVLALGELHVRKSSVILEKLKGSKSNTPKESKPLPPLSVVVERLKIISSLQLKLEQLYIDFKELRVEISSYSLLYDRDQSFRHITTAKLSSYVTAAKVFHKDFSCLEVPAFTFIFDLDLTDLIRASKSEDKGDYKVDLSVILNVTSPRFTLFYDQVSYLFDSLNPGTPAPEKKITTDVKEKEFVKTLIQKSKYIRKGGVKFAFTDLESELHMPKEEGGEFNRQSMDNVITHSGFQSLVFQSSSKNVSDLVARNMACKTPVSLKSFIKLKRFYVEVEENKIYISNLRSLVGVSLQSQKISLKVSCNNVQLKSVNTIIFHVIRKIRELRISASNSACAKLGLDTETEPTGDVAEEAHKELLNIFEVLPSIMHSVKIQVNNLSASIVCKDFLPSHNVYSEQMGEDVDLAQIRRGISLYSGGLQVHFNRDKQFFAAKLNEVEAVTLSDCPGEINHELRDDNDSLSEDVDLNDMSSMDSNMSGASCSEKRRDAHEVKRVVLIKNTAFRTDPEQDHKLLLTLGEVDGSVDTFLFWCIFYAKSLIMMIAPKIELQYTQAQVKKVNRSKKVLNLDIKVESLTIMARVANGVDILVELDRVDFTDVAVSPHCQINYTRLYVVHPITKLWSRLVSISNTFVDLGTITSKSIDVTCRTVRFNIPFQFLVYTVIDNVITFVKAIRQLDVNFEHLSPDITSYKRIEVEAKDAVKMPRIHLKSSILGITLEQDIFESELALIVEFNKFEMIERRRKEAIFNKKAKALRAKAKKDAREQTHGNKKAPEQSMKFQKRMTNLFNNRDRSDTTSSRSTHNSSIWHRKNAGKSQSNETSQHSGEKENGKSVASQSEFSGDQSANESVSSAALNTVQESAPQLTPEEQVEELISEAYEELQKDFATSYIHKFQRFRRSKLKFWRDRMEEIWGVDKVSDVMQSKFKIQEYAPGPPQFHGGFSDLDLVIEDPKIPDIHEFLHKYGKGQPRFEYSILVPLSIDLRSKALYLCARDYELPIVSFPRSGSIDTPSVQIKTTMVINEKLVALKEELRHIFVPFSPAMYSKAKDKDGIDTPDNFYAMNVIRTLTPVKMMFDFECNLDSDRACIVSWCKAYEPAMSTIMMAFENFTKPEIDDSPLGWWDKMALNMHGKARFNVKNELCVHIKSSQSPYALSGRSSGLVFCWKDNVEVKINESGKTTEVLVVQSDGFVLGIPSYAATEGKAWSLLASLKSDDEASDDGKFQKRLMKLSSDEKVVWTVGALFERNKDKNAKELNSNMERVDKFKPHYDVVVTGPMYDYHPDSFEGYRSDYLHLALTVKSSSSKGNAHNVGYLTPLVFDHLAVWWKTLNDIVSTPIREGKLFANSPFKGSSVKFGSHLFTFKYQIILEPLTLSHTYLASGGKDTNHSVVAYGAKGRCSKIIVDLHQRREVARYVNEKLSIDKKIRKLKMNIGEVEVTDADIRLIFCQFNDVSMSGKLLSYYTGETSSSVNDENFDKYLGDQTSSFKGKRGLNVDEGDPSWVDYDDFIELEEREVLAPDLSIKISPFFFTPRFTYLRNFSLEPEDAPYPFGDEPVVHCYIGASSPDSVQAQLVEERTNHIKRRLEHDRKRMEDLSGDDYDIQQGREKYEREIAHGESKVDRLAVLYDEIKSFSREPSLKSHSPNQEDAGDEDRAEFARKNSMASSMYSGYKSLEQAREVIDIADPMFKAFHNRFVIHNLKLKWDNQIRDTFTAFLSVIGDRRTDKLAMSRKALDLLNKMMSNLENQDQPKSSKTESTYEEKKFTCGNDIIESFEEYLSELKEDGYEIESKYLVKFIQPQMHLSSDRNPEARVLMTSEDVELRVLKVDVEGADNIVRDNDQGTSSIETRYGVLFRDTHFFVFESNDGFSEPTNADPYALKESGKSRTPWLQIEDCGEANVFKDNLVAERTTMAMSVKKPNMLSVRSTHEARRSEIIVHLAKFVVTATSSQYSALYFLVTDLLIQRNESNFLRQKIDKISSVAEASDFKELSDRVKMLQSNIRVSSFTLLKLRDTSKKLSELKQRQERHISLELARMKIELMIIIKSLEAVRSRSDSTLASSKYWTVNTDQLIMHFLEDSRVPLADFALAASKFTRIEETDGSNSNHVEVSMVQGFNLQRHAPYPELLKPFLESKKERMDSTTKLLSKPMIDMRWSMSHPVGGIRVMRDAKLAVQPMHVQLDFDSTTKLFNYLFPKDDSISTTDDDAHDNKHKDSHDDEGSRSRSSSDVSTRRRNPPKSLWRKLQRSDRSTNDGSSLFSDLSSQAKETFTSDSKDFASEKDSNGHETTHNGKVVKHKSKKKQKESDDLSLIMKRSAEYLVVESFSVENIQLCLSFKAPKHLNIIDVHDLVFSFPTLSYDNKTWTSRDIAMQLKKDVIKVVLAHSGKIIGNKFKSRKRASNNGQLNQIEDYSHYVSLEELQKNGSEEKDTNGSRPGVSKRSSIRSTSRSSAIPKVAVNAKYEDILEKAPE